MAGPGEMTRHVEAHDPEAEKSGARHDCLLQSGARKSVCGFAQKRRDN
jgi:hypothetical protein